MSLDVGINVVEVDGRATPAIAGAATSVAAFVGATERGLTHRPVRLTNLAQFRDRFGVNAKDGLLGYAVEGFFANGGATAYVSRAAGAAAVPASAVLNDRADAQALTVSAGYRGLPDAGAWGTALTVDVTDEPQVTTALTADVAADDTTAKLASVAGVGPDVVLRMADGPTVVYGSVTSVSGKTVTLAAKAGKALKAATTVLTVAASFTLTVRFRRGTDAAQVETWSGLTMDPGSTGYAPTRLNHPLTGSRLVTVAAATVATTGDLRNLAVVSSVPLLKGVDAAPAAADLSGSADDRTGVHAFDGIAVQLLAVPDAHTLQDDARDEVFHAALDYCAGRGDLMFVGSAPDRGVADGVIVPRAAADYAQSTSAHVAATQAFSAGLSGTKVFGALYTPWIKVADPAGVGPAPARFVPADGHVMGVYARTDFERGIAKAPAGLAAQVRGALDVAARFTDAEHTDLVRNGLVNGIRPTPGAGIVVAASRTLSTDTRWWFVNVRLLFNFVKSSLRDGLRFVRQEPHSEALRRTVRFNVVTPFLMGLWRQGAFGSDPPEQTFTVKCDAENNPSSEVDLGNFRIEVYFYPVRPAETVVIVVGQQPGGGSAAES